MPLSCKGTHSLLGGAVPRKAASHQRLCSIIIGKSLKGAGGSKPQATAAGASSRWLGI